MSVKARDLLYARRAKKAGARPSLRIIYEARRADVPLSLAFALVHQESEFKNVIGGDLGTPEDEQGKPATHARVQEIIRRARNGGKSNGVGLTQLTWLGYILEAEHLGGAHIEKNQLRVGFHALAQQIRVHGERGGLAAYNAGDPHSRKGQVYARQVEAKQDHWHRVLTGGKA